MRLPLIVALLAAAASSLAQTDRSILSPRISTTAPPAAARRLEVRRYRAVSLDGGTLASRSAITLNFFPDASFDASLDRAQSSDDGSSTIWTGKLSGYPFGEAILVISGDLVTGNLNPGDGRLFEIRPDAAGNHWAQEIDLSRLPPDSEPLRVRDSDLPPAAAPDAAPPAADDGSLIDVMVVYTAAARQAAGGAAQMNNLILLGIAETNQGYANSGVIQRVRLAHAEEVVYTESGDAATDLGSLVGTNDGKLDNVHALRDAYGADIVSLWVESLNACGIGYVMTSTATSFARFAFNVVARSCATGNYTFGHEMGHNMGATHDRANSGGPGVFPYSYGYQQTAQSPFFRTIMAYACSGGVNCGRINYWSNPAVAYSGIPTGIDPNASNSADNGLTLNNTRTISANWRQSGAAPVPVSVSPNSGAGASQTFTFTLTSATGATSIASATALFNAALDGSNACFVYYDRLSSAVYLINDASTGSTRVDLGSSATAQNSQCVVNGAGSAAIASGNTLTLVLAIVFKGAFAGAKNVYLSGQDATGQSSGLQKVGVWIVGAAPSLGAVTPASGTGSSQVFQFTFSHPSGATSISSATVLFNAALDGANACFLYFDRPGNAIYLINNSGNGSTRVSLGSGAAQNSQCTVNGAGSSAVASGNLLTLTLALSFAPSFAGSRTIFASAQDLAGLNTGLQPVGVWIVPSAVTAVSVTPASGSGGAQTFTFVFQDANGFSAISSANILINSAIDGRNACYLVFDRAANAVFLVNDTGSGSTRVALGTSASAQNSQCSINGGASSYAGSGNQLALNLALTFTSAFAGQRTLYASGQEGNAAATAFVPLGVYTVIR